MAGVAFTPSLPEKGKPFCIDMTYEVSPPLLWKRRGMAAPAMLAVRYKTGVIF
jgi:hypothetical protein